MQVGRKGQVDHYFGVNHCKGLAGSGQSFLLDGVVLVPGSSHQMLCLQGLLLDLRDELERT